MYLVRLLTFEPTASGASYFKIGKAVSIPNRIKQFGPCELVAHEVHTDPGSALKRETALHSQFKQFRRPDTEIFLMTQQELNQVVTAMNQTNDLKPHQQQKRIRTQQFGSFGGYQNTVLAEGSIKQQDSQMTLPSMPSRDATLRYPGGKLTATRALLVAILKDFDEATDTFTVQHRTRKAHTRTRVIGGESTNVAASEWTHKKFPTTAKQVAKAGKPIKVQFNENGEW